MGSFADSIMGLDPESIAIRNKCHDVLENLHKLMHDRYAANLKVASSSCSVNIYWRYGFVSTTTASNRLVRCGLICVCAPPVAHALETQGVYLDSDI